MMDTLEQPAVGMTTATMESLIEIARLAPSAHNTQPWRFRPRPGRIDVCVAEERRLPVVDPDGHEQFASLGCAIETLLIAGERHGLASDLQLFPHAGRADHVATVRFRPRNPTDRFGDPALFDAIRRRHSHYGRFIRRPIPRETLERLVAGSAFDGAELFLDTVPTTIEQVARIVAEAVRTGHADPDYRRERAMWVGSGALGTVHPWRSLSRFARPWFDIGEREARLDEERIRSAAAVAVITTFTDDRTAQVNAGRAAMRFWLRATHLGIAGQPTTAPLHVPRLRRKLGRALEAHHRCPQIVFRLGYVDREEKPRPRLPLEAIRMS